VGVVVGTGRGRVDRGERLGNVDQLLDLADNTFPFFGGRNVNVDVV